MNFQKAGQENATEMHEIKETRISANYLESESAEFVAEVIAIKPLLYNHPHNREAQIQRHEHVESSKIVTNINLQHKVQISDDYAKYRTVCIKMLSEYQSM